jgi:hypothetical protein
VELLRKIVRTDPDLAADLESLVDSCSRYVEAVVRMEIEAAIVKATTPGDPAAWKAAVGPLDQARSTTHDGLIDRLLAFNAAASSRYGWEPEGRIPVGGAFTLSPDILSAPEARRAEIGDWAYFLTLGLSDLPVPPAPLGGEIALAGGHRPEELRTSVREALRWLRGAAPAAFADRSLDLLAWFFERRTR